MTNDRIISIGDIELYVDKVDVQPDVINHSGCIKVIIYCTSMDDVSLDDFINKLKQHKKNEYNPLNDLTIDSKTEYSRIRVINMDD